LADASYAQTSGYDADGNMDWSTATTWASNLDPYNSNITGWRLPDTNPVNGATYDYGFAYDGSKDEGYNISAAGSAYEGSHASEMAYMFYNTLGNLAPYDSNGSSQSGGGLTNTGPFSNLRPAGYWSATATEANHAFVLYFDYGSQGSDATANPHAAWVVHDGDVGAAVVPPRDVPVPFWADPLLAGLLGSIGMSRRKRSGRGLLLCPGAPRLCAGRAQGMRV
jgi:hypothetical protein